jgi:hypothetical protein
LIKRVAGSRVDRLRTGETRQLLRRDGRFEKGPTSKKRQVFWNPKAVRLESYWRAELDSLPRRFFSLISS